MLGDVGTDVSKEAGRIMHLEQLREHIERGEYGIAVDAVASSIVERLEALRERLTYGRPVELEVERERVSAKMVVPE